MSTTRNASITVVDEDEVGVTSVFKQRGEHALVQEGADHDEVTLVALGYKQEFKRHKPPFRVVIAQLLTSKQRLHHLGIFLRLFLCPGTFAFSRFHYILQLRLLRNGWSAMGLAHIGRCYPSHGFQYGRTMFQYAHRGRTLLRLRRTRSRRMGSLGFLVRWMVKLLRLRDGTVFCQLRAGLDVDHMRHDHQSGL